MCCGLLSEEFAQELLKVSEGGVGKCAIGASKINFSSLQGKLRGVQRDGARRPTASCAAGGRSCPTGRSC